MRKKIAIALSLAMMMSMALTACGGGSGAGSSKPASSTPASSTPAGSNPSASGSQQTSGLAPKDGGTNLTFTTGGETGTYYGFGNVIANKVGDLTSTTINTIASGGSQVNIENMDMNDAQLGFVQSDVMAYAYNGERLFDTKIDSFSTVAALYMEQVQIITLNSSIKSVADLKGKNVSIGDLGSGVYFNAIDVLDAYGLTEDDIKPVYQSFGNSVDSLKDKKIDAAFVVAGAPTTAVVDLVSTNTVYMVELGEDETKALLDASPYYSAYTITAGTY